MSEERNAYIAMVSLGKALIDKENYEKSLINLEYAKAEYEKAEKSNNSNEKVWAKRTLGYAERAVSYCHSIKEGLIADPYTSSTTHWIRAQTALLKSSS